MRSKYFLYLCTLFQYKSITMAKKSDEKKVVTLEELKKLAQKEPYKADLERLRGIDKAFIEECPAFQINWHRPRLFFDHLMLEQSMSDYDSNWKFNTQVYNVRAIAYLEYLWYHPLVWLDPAEELRNDRIIEGRVAAERYVGYRKNENFRYGPILYFRDEMLSWFADKLPKADGTEPIIIGNYRFATLDIILWHYITENPDEMYKLAFAEDGRFDPSLVVPFDPRIFLDSVTMIAESHGGPRAAEIVRLLRKDWTRIVTMKLFDIDKMTAEQIEEFRVALFEGMDYYLEQWESEPTQPQDQPSIIPTCRYIDFDKLAQNGIYTPEQFTTMLRQACEQDAKALGAFLKKYFKMGYLDFHGDNKKKIYEHLKECFPGTIKYSYPNFTQYFD